MAKYTLGEKIEGSSLFVLLCDGKPTKAKVSEKVIPNISDECIITAGEFHAGEFHAGEFHGGVFHGGWFNGGVFHGGVFHGGWFHAGEFHGGWFHGGVFHGGVFHGGVFHAGVFNGGVFHGGVFHGGWFNGGVFHGGWFHGGEFRSGEFRSGEFHGGWFHGGWLPVQIQGTKHFVNCPDGKTIQIGCKKFTPISWKKNFRKIGKLEGYTEEQIQEYELYINLVAEIIERNKEK